MKKYLILSCLLAVVLLAGCLGLGQAPTKLTPIGSTLPPPGSTLPPPGSTLPPPAVVEPCLVGIWQVESLESFFQAMLPPGSFEPGSLAFMSSKGKAAYNFASDGQLGFLATQLQGDFLSKAESIILTLKSDGYASADYHLEGDKIVVGQLRQSAIQFQALLDKESMLDNPRPDDFVPLFVKPYTTARYTCSGDTLSLEILDFPGISGPVELKRSK